MEGKRIIIIALILFLILLCISGIVIKNRLRTQVKELFRMNKDLQEEGYYMSEFEFKMLGIAYYLDKANYYYAVSRLDQLHKQLKFKQNLIKVPEFKSKEDEMEFYLNLQNPETGAFMDDSYPYCTYNEPTENVLSHLAALAKETLKPLCLKYDLKYLDEIKTPDKLTAFLDDVSSVGWIASKFPQTMGNWISKEQIRQELESLEIEKVPVYEEDFPLENANEVLQRNNELVVIGFDVLQIPRYKIVYKYSSE